MGDFGDILTESAALVLRGAALIPPGPRNSAKTCLSGPLRYPFDSCLIGDQRKRAAPSAALGEFSICCRSYFPADAARAIRPCAGGPLDVIAGIFASSSSMLL